MSHQSNRLLDAQNIFKEYNEGKTLSDLGTKHKVHGCTVSRFLRKHGFGIRTKAEASRGARNSQWIGGRIVNCDGYVQVRTDDNRYVLEHRLVAEKYLGRKLTDGEVVHHINGVKTDNRLENLKICTKRSHRKEHKIHRWSKKYDSCIRCHKDDAAHASRGLCSRCSMYARTVRVRGYACIYGSDGKRIFSKIHRQRLSAAARRRYKEDKPCEKNQEPT